ncbi:MAG: putative lipid II flippase FtsW [Candidatus Nealsonbacteria bacterium]|nr:putative lipid II flippase FtsW [Candidatus Nealsonbacteria bacterium]
MEKRISKNSAPDLFLLGSIAFLVVFGVIILASVSAPLSQAKIGTSYYFLNHQILYGLLPGLALALLAFKVRLETIKKWAPILLLINLVLLLLVFVPVIGVEAKGASRWLNFGLISFQPSELLKLTFVLYLASFLAARSQGQDKKSSNFTQTFAVFLVIIGLIGLLLALQPDVSTLGIIAVVASLMYFLAQTPIWHSALIIILGTGGLALLVRFASYRINRLLTFLNPELDPMGKGYQAKQALITIGSGGLLGQGLGLSQQKFGLLPEAMSDSIFAVFSEEAGFLGAILLLASFLVFLWASFRVIRRTKDSFPKLAALGITGWISLQALINISSMAGLLPLAGIPLPFVSYGGSALITELAGMGILLNISKSA